MLEVYRAYGDYRTMMDLTEKIIAGAIAPPATPRLAWGARRSIQPAVCPKTYDGAFAEHSGVDPNDAARWRLPRRSGWSRRASTGRGRGEVFEAKVEDRLAGPVFVTDCPASITR